MNHEELPIETQAIESDVKSYVPIPPSSLPRSNLSGRSVMLMKGKSNDLQICDEAEELVRVVSKRVTPVPNNPISEKGLRIIEKYIQCSEIFDKNENSELWLNAISEKEKPVIPKSVILNRFPTSKPKPKHPYVSRPPSEESRRRHLKVNHRKVISEVLTEIQPSIQTCHNDAATKVPTTDEQGKTRESPTKLFNEEEKRLILKFIKQSNRLLKIPIRSNGFEHQSNNLQLSDEQLYAELNVVEQQHLDDPVDAKPDSPEDTQDNEIKMQEVRESPALAWARRFGEKGRKCRHKKQEDHVAKLRLNHWSNESIDLIQILERTMRSLVEVYLANIFILQSFFQDYWTALLTPPNESKCENKASASLSKVKEILIKEIGNQVGKEKNAENHIEGLSFEEKSLYQLFRMYLNVPNRRTIDEIFLILLYTYFYSTSSPESNRKLVVFDEENFAISFQQCFDEITSFVQEVPSTSSHNYSETLAADTGKKISSYYKRSFFKVPKREWESLESTNNFIQLSPQDLYDSLRDVNNSISKSGDISISGSSTQSKSYSPRNSGSNLKPSTSRIKKIGQSLPPELVSAELRTNFNSLHSEAIDTAMHSSRASFNSLLTKRSSSSGMRIVELLQHQGLVFYESCQNETLNYGKGLLFTKQHYREHKVNKSIIFDKIAMPVKNISCAEPLSQFPEVFHFRMFRKENLDIPKDSFDSSVALFLEKAPALSLQQTQMLFYAILSDLLRSFLLQLSILIDHSFQGNDIQDADLQTVFGLGIYQCFDKQTINMLLFWLKSNQKNSANFSSLNSLLIDSVLQKFFSMWPNLSINLEKSSNSVKESEFLCQLILNWEGNKQVNSIFRDPDSFRPNINRI